MTTTHTLIVNRNGLLSACPTHELYKAGNYFVSFDVVYVYSVRIHPSTYKHLYENRDNAYIIGDQLPARADVPGRIYYKLEDNQLKKA